MSESGVEPRATGCCFGGVGAVCVAAVPLSGGLPPGSDAGNSSTEPGPGRRVQGVSTCPSPVPGGAGKAGTRRNRRRPQASAAPDDFTRRPSNPRIKLPSGSLIRDFSHCGPLCRPCRPWKRGGRPEEVGGGSIPQTKPSSIGRPDREPRPGGFVRHDEARGPSTPRQPLVSSARRAGRLVPPRRRHVQADRARRAQRAIASRSGTLRTRTCFTPCATAW